MANYVFNYLYADENLIKKYFNEEGKFDFGKVIPIPEILNIERNHCVQRTGEQNVMQRNNIMKGDMSNLQQHGRFLIRLLKK